QHHHDVGPLGGLRDFHDLELLALGLLDALRALAQRDRNVLDARVTEIERVGVALAAIADNGDLLALDQVQVGVAIVINTHGGPSPPKFVTGRNVIYAGKSSRHGAQIGAPRRSRWRGFWWLERTPTLMGAAPSAQLTVAR